MKVSQVTQVYLLPCAWLFRYDPQDKMCNHLDFHYDGSTVSVVVPLYNKDDRVWDGGELVIDSPRVVQFGSNGLPPQSRGMVTLDEPTIAYRGSGEGDMYREVHQLMRVHSRPGDLVCMPGDIKHGVAPVTGHMRYCVAMFFGVILRLRQQALFFPEYKPA